MIHFLLLLLLPLVYSSETRFTEVYEKNLWLDRVSRSGMDNFIQSGNEYFIISNNKGATNEDKIMEGGDSRSIDITAPPFSFGRIIMEFDHLSLFYIDKTLL